MPLPTMTAALGPAAFATGVDASSYSTASWTPTANRLVIAFVGYTTGGADTVPTLSGNGITWTFVASNSLSQDVACFVGLTGASPSTGATTADFAGVTQTHCTIHILQVDGANISGTALQAVAQYKLGNGTGTSGSLTLDAAPLSSSRCFFGVQIAVNENVVPRTSWTELGDLGHGNPTRRLESQWRSDAAEQTGSATWTTSVNYRAVLLEIKGSMVWSGSQGSETDTGNAGVPAVAPAGAQATETETADSGAASVTVSGIQAALVVTANAGSPLVTLAGSQASEVDTADPGAASTVVIGSQVTETDTAADGTTATQVAGAQASESDTGTAGAPAVALAGALADETDTANAGSTSSGATVNGTKAVETDSAFAGTPVVTLAGSVAAEVDSAFSRQVPDANPRRVTYTEPSYAVLHQDPTVTHQDPADLVYQEG